MVRQNSKYEYRNTKPRIKKGDKVRILRGKDRGKTSQVLGLIKRQGKVLVEGVNMVKKHLKPKRAGEKGQRVAVASPLPVANVQLVCPVCQQTTRVGVKREDGRRQRICKKCQAII